MTSSSLLDDFSKLNRLLGEIEVSKSGVGSSKTKKIRNLGQSLARKVTSFAGKIVEEFAEAAADGAFLLSGQEDFQSREQLFTKNCEAIEKDIKRIKCVDKRDLHETRKQLKQREVLISFYGQYSAGKSTLLNAIFHKRLLPTKAEPETSFQLKIQPVTFSNAKGFDIKLEYQLKIGNHIEAKGVENIYKSLEARNERVRDHVEVPYDDHVLQVSSNLFDNIGKEWKVTVVDNPGYNESTAHITKMAEWSRQLSTACVFVTTNDQYRQKDFADVIKKMYGENPRVFSQNRLLIVVNKLDRLCFSGIDEADVTWVEVAEKVHKYIKKICACSDDDDDDDDKDIPKKAVIPICSKWAYEAQMLKQDPTSEKIRRSVKVSLNNIPSNETTPEGSEELADSLLDFSNIMELEKRVPKASFIQVSNIKEFCCLLSPFNYTMLKHINITAMQRFQEGLDTKLIILRDVGLSCIDSWEDKIRGDYRIYLDQCIKTLQKQRQAQEKLLRAREGSASGKLKPLLDIFSTYKAVLETATSKTSPICAELTQCCKEDMKKSDELKKNGMDRLKSHLLEFERDVLEKITNGEIEYGPNEFHTDMEKIVKKTEGSFQGILNERCSFNNLLSCRTRYLEKIISDVARMATCVEKIVPDSRRSYDAMISKESLTKFPVLKLPSLTAVDVAVPEVNRNFLQKFIDYIAFFFERVHEKVQHKEEKFKDTDSVQEAAIKKSGRNYSKWQPNLKEAILKLEEAIETEIDKVFKDSGFRKEVVELLHVILDFLEYRGPKYYKQKYWRSYCDLTKAKLLSFDETFEPALVAELESLSAAIDDIGKQREIFKSLEEQVYEFQYKEKQV